MAKPLSAAYFRPRQRIAIASMPLAKTLATRVSEGIGKVLSQLATATWRVAPERIEESSPPPSGPYVRLLRLESAMGSLILRLILDRAAISAVIEALMGGNGTEASFDIGERPISGIEAAALDTVMSRIADESAKVLTVHFERPFSYFPEDARSSPSALLEECVSFRFILNVFGYSGEIIMSMARSEFTQQITTGAAQADDPARMMAHQQLKREVGKSEVELTVTLAPEKLFVEDIAGLRVGQMISLSSTASGSVTLWSGGIATFTGTLARARDRLAVNITSAIT